MFPRRLFSLLTRGRDPAPAPTIGSDPEPQWSVDLVRARLEGAGRDAVLLDRGLAAYVRRDSGPDAAHLRALLLMAWCRYREASIVFRDLVSHPGSPARMLLDAGWCAHLSGALELAGELLDRAVVEDPDLVEAQFAKAVVHLARSQFAEAREGFDRVVKVAPDYPDVWLNVSAAQRGLGNAEGAEAAARRAVEHAPQSAAAWCLLGRTLKMAGRDVGEAFGAYRRARECEVAYRDNAGTTALHVVGLYESGRYAEAIALCENVLPKESDPEANTAYSLALLTLGRFVEGWRQYEYRWFTEPMRSVRVRYDRPRWVGQPLAGKCILLRMEQGIGDTVQFARYAGPLKAQGARVILHVHAGIAGLAAGFHDVDSVVEKLEPPYAFDYYIDMLSLPRAAGTTLDTIPATIPYLSVAPSYSQKWVPRLAAQGPRVGLVWSGNPKHARDRARSVALERLAPLWTVRGVHLVSLQKEVRDTDAPFMPPAGVLDHLGPELEDLCDAAAVIEQLDLLVTVDTGLAHVAGAMGKPVWVLIPTHADFRWLTDRDDSPWYPTMRLVRQREPGDWDEVISRIAVMLEKLAAGDRSQLAPPPAVPASPDQPAAGIAHVGEMRNGIMQYLPDHDDEARSLAHLGEYLVSELDLVARLITPDARVIEVGSGFGSHAIWLARTLTAEARIFLYESDPVIARILRQNLAANRVLDSVTLPRGTLAAEALDQTASRTPLHTIDDLALERLDLLKIRSSNAEAILRANAPALWRLRPTLLVQVHEPSVQERLRTLMSESGYRVWRVASPLYRAANFHGWSEDVFGGRCVVSLLGIAEESDAGTGLADASHGIEPLQ